MIEYSHTFGIALFADISFALKQQHAMRMIYAKDLPTQLRHYRLGARRVRIRLDFDRGGNQ
jgi:hypothetical protein